MAWEYDLAGNTTSLTDANGTNTFGYDELNRKTSETGQGPGGTIDYTYDPAGNVTSSRGGRGARGHHLYL